jgi:hypothetical protein
MCNHYSKGQKKWDRDKASGDDLRQDELIEWSETRIPLRMPATLPAFNDHIYPKYPAPVIVQVEKDRQLVPRPGEFRSRSRASRSGSSNR